MPGKIVKPYLDPRAEELLATMSVPRKALFLDRDGVINFDRGYVHKPEDTEWLPGIFELCAKAQLAGYVLIVVTNQAGIARGYYGVEEFLDYTSWVHEQFTLKGGQLTATYYCPHHPDVGFGGLRCDCNCRKPKPGMILEASRQLRLDLSSSFLLGDKVSDLAAAKNAGVAHSVLIGDLGGLDELGKLMHAKTIE